MYEVFPLIAGVTIALMMQYIAAPQLRAIVLVVFSTIFGVTASFISGELTVSWGFLIVDIALVLLASVVTRMLLAFWSYRIQRYRRSRYGRWPRRFVRNDLSRD